MGHATSRGCPNELNNELLATIVSASPLNQTINTFQAPSGPQGPQGTKQVRIRNWCAGWAKNDVTLRGRGSAIYQVRYFIISTSFFRCLTFWTNHGATWGLLSQGPIRKDISTMSLRNTSPRHASTILDKSPSLPRSKAVRSPQED